VVGLDEIAANVTLPATTAQGAFPRAVKVAIGCFGKTPVASGAKVTLYKQPRIANMAPLAIETYGGIIELDIESPVYPSKVTQVAASVRLPSGTVAAGDRIIILVQNEQSMRVRVRMPLSENLAVGTATVTFRFLSGPAGIPLSVSVYHNLSLYWRSS